MSSDGPAAPTVRHEQVGREPEIASLLGTRRGSSVFSSHQPVVRRSLDGGLVDIAGSLDNSFSPFQGMNFVVVGEQCVGFYIMTAIHASITHCNEEATSSRPLCAINWLATPVFNTVLAGTHNKTGRTLRILCGRSPSEESDRNPKSFVATSVENVGLI
jgi:hypothetical protein